MTIIKVKVMATSGGEGNITRKGHTPSGKWKMAQSWVEQPTF